MSQSTVKRIYKSHDDKMLFGVCGGLGEYFSLDPVLVRLITIVFTLVTGGLGIIAYILFAIIMPDKEPKN